LKYFDRHGRLYQSEESKIFVNTRQENPVKKLTLLRPEGSRRAGRPKLRWLNGVEEDLRNLGIRDWRRRALVGDRWKEILTAAMTQNGL